MSDTPQTPSAAGQAKGPVSLDGELVARLVALAAANRTVAYDESFVEDAARLRLESLSHYESLVSQLRKVGVRLAPWEKVVAAEQRRLQRIAENRALQRTIDGPPWQAKLLLTRQGEPRSSLYNILLMLTEDPRWQGKFRLNVIGDVVEVADHVTSMPFADALQWDYSQVWRDKDDARLLATIEKELGFSPSIQTVAAAVAEVAARDSYNPVAEYLAALPEWDGKTRIDTFFADYFQAHGHPSYLKMVARWFFISAVKRANIAGCKCDYMVVLEGSQGDKKSQAVEVLGGRWYGSMGMAGLGQDKDSYQNLRGKWIVEFAELAGMNMGDGSVERIKRYLSESTDTYRPSYARRSIDQPRRNVFIGTVNDHDWLRDRTGNRRFWPVKVGEMADLESLRRDRDQLFAEALWMWTHDYRSYPLLAGEQPDASKGEENVHHLVVREQSLRLAEDPWERRIVDWVQEQINEWERTPLSQRLEGQEKVWSLDLGMILEKAVGKRAEYQTVIDLKRAGAAAKSAGLTPRRQRVRGNPRQKAMFWGRWEPWDEEDAAEQAQEDALAAKDAAELAPGPAVHVNGVKAAQVPLAYEELVPDFSVPEFED